MENNIIIYQIYTLEHPITGEIRYVGATRNTLKRRLRGHIRDSYRHSYHNSNWIRSIVNIGLEPIIKQIEICDVDNWNEIEGYWISQFKAWGYNLTNDKDFSNNKYVYSKETRQKLRVAQLGKKMSEETKLKIKNSLILTKSKTDNSISKSTKEKISKKLIGKPLSNITKQKLSIAQRGKHATKILQYDLNGLFIREWDSIQMAEKHLNITGISACCRGKCVSISGFIWKYFETNFSHKILSYSNKLIKFPVIKLDLQGNKLQEFDSIYQASKICNIDKDTISKCCSKKGYYKSAGGFKWEFKLK